MVQAKNRGQKLVLIASILFFSLVDLSYFVPSPAGTYTDQLFARAKKKKQRKGAAQKTKFFTLNFKDVDIAEFVNIMSQLVGKNIILDDTVKGKITISSAKKVPIARAYEIMKSILEIKGLAVVESDNLIKILPIQDAIKKNVEIILDNKKRMIGDNTVTFLLELENADAREVMNVLNTLKSKNTTIVVFAPLNTLILSGNASEIKGLTGISKALDKEIKVLGSDIPRGNVHVIQLENAKAEDLAAVLSRIPFSEKAIVDNSPLPLQNQKAVQDSKKAQRIMGTQKVEPQSQAKGKLSILAYKDTNALIVAATPEEFKEIKRIIKELDVVREQVFIEALIMEVSADSGWNLGIDWMLGNQSGPHMYGGSSNMGSASYNYTAPQGLAGKKLAVPLNAGFQVGYLSDKSILGFVLLNAAGKDNNFNVISTPQMLTTDNHEAELNIVQEFPFQSTSRISEIGSQFITWEYKSVGVKIKLTPHITKKQNLTMDLFMEVSSIIGTFSSTQPPTTRKRDIKTKIYMSNGRTVVIGGLIENQKVIQETKVPVLGDVPLLGWLFKRKSVQYIKSNLMVFITPQIVTKTKMLDIITRQKREEQRQLKFKTNEY